MAEVAPIVIRRKPGGAGGKALGRRFTFSLDEESDPCTPKTPALTLAQKRLSNPNPFDESSRDLVVSVPMMIDQCVITIQNRMARVGHTLNKNAKAFDEENHKMEHDMFNALYVNMQNISYHLNKIVVQLNTREDKQSRPMKGVDGPDILAGMNGAMTRCQQNAILLTKLVNSHKKMKQITSTTEVIGESGVDILEKVEGAMRQCMLVSGRVADAAETSEKARQISLVKKAAAAFLQIQAATDPNYLKKLALQAWSDAVKEIKEEREKEATAALEHLAVAVAASD